MIWYDSHQNLVGLAYWLDVECTAFWNVPECIYFFEKPWKWNREYELWRIWGRAGTAELRERCVDAAIDGTTEAADVLAELADQ